MTRRKEREEIVKKSNFIFTVGKRSLNMVEFKYLRVYIILMVKRRKPAWNSERENKLACPAFMYQEAIREPQHTILMSHLK